MEEEFSYWEIHFKSCEGNEKWTVARAPHDWDEEEVKNTITLGGYGDDPAYILSIYATYNTDYSWDFCNN